jgi:hypothetical protein
MNVPDALWEYIVYQESSFNAGAVGAGAYGLFQLQVGGGQGDSALAVLTGHGGPWSDVEKNQLLDAGINTRFGLPPISAAWEKYKNSFDNSFGWWTTFCAESGHPGGSSSDPVTIQYVNIITANYNKGLFGTLSKGQGAGNPGSGTGSTGGVKIPATTPNKKAWYRFPRVDNIGHPDPFGGFPKPDSNIQVPAGYPLTALLPGTVTGVNHAASFGAVVTIKFDVPPATNPKAAYYFYEHMRSDIPVKVGDHVFSSQIIGYNGSSQAEGSQKVPCGFGLNAGPSYGADGAWGVTNANIMTVYNPVQLLDQAANGTLPGLIDPQTGGISTAGGPTTGGTSSGGTGNVGTAATIVGGNQTYSPLLAQVHQTITANQGFIAIALAMDEIEQLPGWIDLTDQYNVGLGITIPDPVGLMRSVGATVADNAAPVLVRAGIISAGVLILILLLLKLIDDSGLTGDVAGMLVA